MQICENHVDVWLELSQGKVFVRIWNQDAAGRVPIVMLHESLGSVEQWHDFPCHLALASGRPVIAYDRLGFGRSDSHPEPWTFDFIAEEAQIYFPQIREQLGIKNFIVFGHSVGGGMAVNCAARFPENCRALITESAQAFVDDKVVAGIERARHDFAKHHTLEQLARYHGNKTEWVFHAWVDTWLASGFRAWSLDEVLPNIICPTLAINGELDQYCSMEHPRRITSLVNGPAQARMIKGAGHIPHKEDENLVIELMCKFLNKYQVYVDGAG